RLGRRPFDGGLGGPGAELVLGIVADSHQLLLARQWLDAEIPDNLLRVLPSRLFRIVAVTGVEVAEDTGVVPPRLGDMTPADGVEPLPFTSCDAYGGGVLRASAS